MPVNTTCFSRRESEWEAAPFAVARRVQPDDVVRVDGFVLENRHLRVELSQEGTVTSVFDKNAGRETLAAPGNRLELYDDDPIAFDAWDIDPYTLSTRRDAPPAESHELVSATPEEVTHGAWKQFQKDPQPLREVVQVIRREYDRRRDWVMHQISKLSQKRLNPR